MRGKGGKWKAETVGCQDTRMCTTWGTEPICVRYRISSQCRSFKVTGNEVKSESESHSVVSDSLQSHGNSPWNSLGQNTGVGSLFLLQGIFPTQRSNPGLPHCRRILYQLSHKESPRILVGSLSLLQRIFQTQESNRSLLHCRHILYQLSYQGSPYTYI